MPAKGTHKIIVDAEFLAKASELSATMFCDEMIWEGLGIKSRSFYDLMKKDSQFAQAIKGSRAKRIATVASKLHKKIEEGDTTAIIFFLKCHAGWIEADKRKMLDLKMMDHKLKKEELELKALIAAKFTPQDAAEFLEKYGSVAA